MTPIQCQSKILDFHPYTSASDLPLFGSARSGTSMHFTLSIVRTSRDSTSSALFSGTSQMRES